MVSFSHGTGGIIRINDAIKPDSSQFLTELK